MSKTTNLVSMLGCLLLTALVAGAQSKPRLDLEQFTRRVPDRVQAEDGTPGDMVNFVLVGTREQVETALAAAGWKKVDRSKTEAAVRAVLSTIQKKPYPGRPRGDFFFWGGARDYGSARAEPLAVVAERHHFRLWEAPWLTTNGKVIWVGAGTHDTGFEDRKRTGQVTHKIDPEVDKERDFLRESLAAAGKIAGWGHILTPEPVREASTAHGGPYRSDGRVLVILLK